jgi:hypothetical protein
MRICFVFCQEAWFYVFGMNKQGTQSEVAGDIVIPIARRIVDIPISDSCFEPIVSIPAQFSDSLVLLLFLF